MTQKLPCSLHLYLQFTSCVLQTGGLQTTSTAITTELKKNPHLQAHIKRVSMQTVKCTKQVKRANGVHQLSAPTLGNI